MIAYAYDAAFFQNASEGELRAEEGVAELHVFEENDLRKHALANLHEQRTSRVELRFDAE
ncbi:hypothetical protein UB51_14640 [Paenibacillus sp. IHBB 10380]|nr:hypothetical protein UB51_14640 [Paenibacillus sp. IHBB 10380]